MKKGSVVIPTYNREKTILRSVQSVLEQTYSDIEVLVIDDGSDDATGEVVKRIEDDRVRYIRLEQNGGVSNARNTGARMAQGEWIAFQDSDDCWRKDKLEKQMTYAEQHPEYDMVYGLYLTHFPDGRKLVTPVEPWPDVMEGQMQETLLVRNVIGAPTVLVKREAFLESGGFDTSYKSLEDWEYAIRFAQNHQIGFVSEILMDVYMQQGGISSHVGNYYDGRCRMLGAYKKEMLQAGVFDTVAMDILTRAQNAGILGPVQKMMEAYIHF